MKTIFALGLLSISLSACPKKTKDNVSKPTRAPAAKTEKDIKQQIGITKKIVVTPKQNALAAYKIDYPKGWEFKSKILGVDSMALSPSEGPKDLFRENINVVIEKKVGSMNTKSYFDANLVALKKYMADFKKISSSELRLKSGIPAMDLIYSHRLGDLQATSRAVFVYEKNRGYVITATARPDTFETFSPEFDAAIQSFKVN